MKKRILSLLIIPLLMSGCGSSESFNTVSVDAPVTTGEIGEFNLLTPVDGFATNTGFTFTWEAASNANSYSIEISADKSFYNDKDAIYVKENNISLPKFDLNYTLPIKDIVYYWRVTAINKDHTKVSKQVRQFKYNSSKVGEIPIEIEDAQDWSVHKEGSEATVAIDRSNFFGNNKNSLVISFDKEHTSTGPVSKIGWIVVTKTEDRELYGTDAFYLNFYYSGHDSTILIRVLDYDGEYWHNQVKVSNNAKQTVLMKYDDFSLRTAGTNIANRKFDWYHIRYFEIVFEKTFGDGVCMLSNIKAVNFEDYQDMFVKKMDFRMTDSKEWTYENYNFDKIISEDGNELTISYSGSIGYGFQNVNVYKFLSDGDALRMKVKYTGSNPNAMFYFRVLEEDKDRWQFKVPFSYLTKDDYKELVIPLKALQRTTYMNGDGAKQLNFIQKFNFGLADNYVAGTISLKDLEVITIVNDVIETNTRVIPASGMIEDFNNYNIYTEMYYYWEQSLVNKDEAMKLDTIHKTRGHSNNYCAEFDYKADLEMATYQLYMDTSKVKGMNAFQIELKDATPRPDNSAFDYLTDDKIAVQFTIQLTMDSGEWYRYTIKAVKKEWHTYTVPFIEKKKETEGFTLVNKETLIDDPKPLSSDHIIHMGFGLQYFFYNEDGKTKNPTYATANPVFLDNIRFVNTDAKNVTIEEIPWSIRPDTGNENQATVDDLESMTNETLFDYWAYGKDLEVNSLTLSDEVSGEGGEKSIKMNYKGSESVSYERITPFAQSVQAYGMCIDIKADTKAKIHLNLNYRNGEKVIKFRYTIEPAMYASSSSWYHYEIGFNKFKDVDGSKNSISYKYMWQIETISFGITNTDDSTSSIYVDNILFSKDLTYTTETATIIA